MSDRFTNQNNTAPVQKAQENQEIKVPSSAFDFSGVHSTTGLIGAIIPIDLIETVPRETHKLSVDLLALSSNPIVRRYLGSMRIYVHSFYMSTSDGWEGADNFYTKGRSGKIELKKPRIRLDYKNSQAGYKDFTVCTPMSLANYLGLPAKAYDSNVSEIFQFGALELKNDNIQDMSKFASEIDALPFVMYQKIYRDNYAPKNLLQTNKHWLPDNEDHFILPYNADVVDVLDYDNPLLDFDSATCPLIVDDVILKNGDNFASKLSGNLYCPSDDDDSPVWLSAIRFHQFKGDTFTTALPFPDLIRGDTPTIDFSNIFGSIDTSSMADLFELTDIGLKYTKFTKTGGYGEASMNPDNPYVKAHASGNLEYGPLFNLELSPNAGAHVVRTQDSSYISGNFSGLNAQVGTENVKHWLEDMKFNILRAGISLNDLRALEAYTIFAERNARTDGDYNSLIKAQFDYDPKKPDRTCKYIGGCFQDIVFNEVLSTNKTDTEIQGDRVSNAISANSGYIGECFSPDFGYIMTVAFIVPDVYYTDGVPRMFTKNNQSDQYFPILNNLSPQAILNKEISNTGNSADDDDIYGYAERYEEFKSRRNRASGLLGVSPNRNAEFGANIMARRNLVGVKPALNNHFLTMTPDNIDMSIFSNSITPPFILSSYVKDDKVSPFPYITVPGGLSARA